MITFLVDHDDEHGHRHELTEDHGEQERTNFGWFSHQTHQLKLRTLLSTPRHRDVHGGWLQMLVAPTQQQEADTATSDPSTLVFVSTTLAGTATFIELDNSKCSLLLRQLQGVPTPQQEACTVFSKSTEVT